MLISYTLEHGELLCSGFDHRNAFFNVLSRFIDQLLLCAYEFALQILISSLLYECFMRSFENSVLLFLLYLLSLLRARWGV
jgi:hypothetical protein